MNVVTQFIAGLNETQKKLLWLAMVILVAALFDRLLIAPTMGRIASINEDIAKEKALIKQDLHFLEYKKRILKENQLMSVYVTKKLLTDDEMIAAFLKRIEGLANQSRIVLIKVNPGTGQQETDHITYQADLECSGKLADIITFMHLANTSKDLLKVIKFNLVGKKSDTDEIKATMTILRMVVTAEPLPPKATTPPPAAS